MKSMVHADGLTRSGGTVSPGDALARARHYGIDLGLLESMLRRTPAERLHMLDEEIRFFQEADSRRRQNP